MGYMRHHGFLITGLDRKDVERAHLLALKLFADEMVSELKHSPVNDYCSFAIFPDCSKAGWSMADDFHAARELFIKLLRGLVYEDNSPKLEWALIQYGDDDGDNKILECSE